MTEKENFIAAMIQISLPYFLHRYRNGSPPPDNIADEVAKLGGRLWQQFEKQAGRVSEDSKNKRSIG